MKYFFSKFCSFSRFFKYITSFLITCSLIITCFFQNNLSAHPHRFIKKYHAHKSLKRGKNKVKTIAGMRYNSVRSKCNYQLNPAIKTTWQTYSPEDLVDLQEGVELGIRDKFDKTTEDAEETIKVIAKVRTPNGRVRQAVTEFNFEDWAYVKFPFDFHKRGDFFAESGSYTVIWTTESGKFLACDGFVAK
jgi:hypothetical protein